MKKRYIAATAEITAAVLIFAAVYNPVFVGASAATRQLPIYGVERDN